VKVLLVATNRERFPYPVAPLGTLCVAAAARAAGHEVDFLDLGLAGSPQIALRRALQQGGYRAVGFGIRNLDNCWAFAPKLFFDEVRVLAEVVRECFSGPLILGGTGFSVAPFGWMDRLQADYGVIGEGERAFPELLARLESGRPVDGIDGVLRRGVLRAENGAPARTAESLSELSPPAHALCNYAKYQRLGGFVGVQTKRGCPYRCTYCIYPQLEGRRYRLRSPESVVREIEEVAARAKVRHFFFVDSVFNDPRAHALAICQELIRRRPPVRWSAFCNPTGFDAELARAMKQAGCDAVEFGVDTANTKMLAVLGKQFSQPEIKTALEAAHGAGLPFVIYLLFGGPGETWADVEDTQKFLNDCPQSNAVFTTYGIRIYEGTPLAETAARDGQIKPGQDLFEPVYYLSPAMADRPLETLDRIARRRTEWTSPADWRRPAMGLARRIQVLFDVRPSWKNIRGYGRYIRRWLK
jgi:radical SAM superfamily enzyme YgiQ (UPF0313 family)